MAFNGQSPVVVDKLHLIQVSLHEKTIIGILKVGLKLVMFKGEVAKNLSLCYRSTMKL